MTRSIPWLRRTGQRWKVHVFLALMGVAGFATVADRIAIRNPSLHPHELEISAAGILAGGIGLLWLTLSVRCAHCGERIAWKIVRESSFTNWLTVLWTIERCPSCGR